MATSRTVRTLRVLLLVGAAVSEASPDQKDAIRELVLPAIEEDASERRVWALLRQVMGSRWRPTGEWAKQLAALRG